MSNYVLFIIIIIFYIVLFICALFMTSNESSILSKAFFVIFLNICSFMLSDECNNIIILYVTLFLQIITFFYSIKMQKTISKKTVYYITVFIVEFCTIFFITLSFGTYYYENGIISVPSLRHFVTNTGIFQDIFYNILFELYLIYKSLFFYFKINSDFVKLTQFCIGIALFCTIFESIFFLIKEFIKYED